MLLYFDRDGLSTFKCHQNQQHKFFTDDDTNMMRNIRQNLVMYMYVSIRSEMYRICKRGIDDQSEISRLI